MTLPNEYFAPGVRVNVQQDWIDVSGPVSRINRKWLFTDKRGHVHRWAGSDLPTLTRKTDIVYCECCGQRDDEWYECRACGEEIHPSYTTTYEYKRLPGLRTVELRNVPLTQEQQEVMFSAPDDGKHFGVRISGGVGPACTATWDVVILTESELREWASDPRSKRTRRPGITMS